MRQPAGPRQYCPDVKRSLPILFAALLAIGGCGKSDKKTDSAEKTTTTAAAEETLLVLEVEGLGLTTADSGKISHIPFGAAHDGALSAVGEALGDANDDGPQPDCPAGPAVITQYDELTLTFQNGSFVGWTVPDDSSLTTADGIGIGTTVAELKDAYGEVNIDEASIGNIFAAGDLFGLVDTNDDDGKVTAFWAGTTCIFD